MSLPVPIGCVDVIAEPLSEDLVNVRWTDALLGEVVEVEATLDQVAEWEREGAPPDSLTFRRWTLDDLDEAIERLQARQAQLASRRDAMVSEHPSLKSVPKRKKQ